MRFLSDLFDWFVSKPRNFDGTVILQPGRTYSLEELKAEIDKVTSDDQTQPAEPHQPS